MYKIHSSILISAGLLLVAAGAATAETVPAPDPDLGPVYGVCALLTVPPVPLPPLPPLPEAPPPADAAIDAALALIGVVYEVSMTSIIPLVPLLREMCTQAMAATEALVDAILAVLREATAALEHLVEMALHMVYEIYDSLCAVTSCFPPWAGPLLEAIEQVLGDFQDAVMALVDFIINLVQPVCSALLCGPMPGVLIEQMRAAAHAACVQAAGPQSCEPLA